MTLRSRNDLKVLNCTFKKTDVIRQASVYSQGRVFCLEKISVENLQTYLETVNFEIVS